MTMLVFLATAILVGTFVLERIANKFLDASAPKNVLVGVMLLLGAGVIGYLVVLQQGAGSSQAGGGGSSSAAPSTTASASDKPKGRAKQTKTPKPSANPSATPSASGGSDTSTPEPSTPDPSPDQSPSQSPSESPTQSVSAPSESATPSATAPPPPSVRVYYLARVTKTLMVKEGRAGGCTGGCTGFNAGAGRIAGSSYPTSWLMEADASGARSTTDWNLATSCSRLQGTVGLSDASAVARVTFTVALNGGAPTEIANVGLNEPAPLDMDLTGVGQLQIAAYVTSSDGSEADVILGDLQATCSEGSLQTY